jgi:CheY-like chemotaxis protein
VIDPVQAQQVLLNLGINARDAADGHGRIAVHVQRRRIDAATCASCGQTLAGAFAEMAVADDGPGIPAGVLEHMFEPFFSTKVPGKGSGMGLAMVHRVVHEHRGHVLVESDAGRGTRFRILLPEADPAALRAAPDAAPAAGAPRFRGHVLLVDDEGSVLGFMRELLSNWGLRVSTAASGNEAHAMLGRDVLAFDLLLTDQTMPGLTGLELAEAARTLRADLPVILYSANVGEIAPHAGRLGLARVLNKPIEPIELRDALRWCLEHETTGTWIR